MYFTHKVRLLFKLRTFILAISNNPNMFRDEKIQITKQVHFYNFFPHKIKKNLNHHCLVYNLMVRKCIYEI